MSSCNIESLRDILVDSVSVCFGTQAALPVTIATVEREIIHGDIVASIGIVDNLCVGFISFIFPEQSFLHIANHMLGEQETSIHNGNCDAAAELLNITYGLARPKLNNKGHGFAPSIPTVVRGNSITLNESKIGKSFYLEAKLESNHSFYISGTVTMRQQSGKTEAA